MYITAYLRRPKGADEGEKVAVVPLMDRKEVMIDLRST
jgi:hypothetical protein